MTCRGNVQQKWLSVLAPRSGQASHFLRARPRDCGGSVSLRTPAGHGCTGFGVPIVSTFRGATSTIACSPLRGGSRDAPPPRQGRAVTPPDGLAATHAVPQPASHNSKHVPRLRDSACLQPSRGAEWRVATPGCQTRSRAAQVRVDGTRAHRGRGQVRKATLEQRSEDGESARGRGAVRRTRVSLSVGEQVARAHAQSRSTRG
jgi:hypothetical protein